MANDIKYPYLPEDRTILYVPSDNEFMVYAKELAKRYRSNISQPMGAVIVKDGKIIGEGSVGNNPIHLKGCERARLGIPTGQGYDLCEGCSPKFHSEPSAIRDAQSKKNNPKDADIYLYGHWWCCKDCWDSMIKAGIRNVYLLEGSEILLNRENPKNILGKQFE